MSKQKEGGWFTPRTYNHFDYPLTFAAAEKLACSPALVAAHQFLPLIGYTDKKRRFRTDNSDRTIPRKLRPKLASTKRREIRYASHSDAAILQYYAYLISDPYEAFLKQVNLDTSVIGYRKGMGSNVDMAAEAFSEIVVRGNVTAFCFDIEDFFPSIEHRSLKSGLELILGCKNLPDDWYKIYRFVTKFSWIEFEKLAEVEGFDPRNPPFPLVGKINPALDRCRDAQLININRMRSGIPQGTPISAVAANIAMIDFDCRLAEKVNEIGGSYRRYSDDILILVHPDSDSSIEKFVNNEASRCGLKINLGKTEISRFKLANGVQQSDRAIAYLGFCFDGSKTYLRPSTLSRYYRRMTYAARGAVRGSGKKGRTAAETFKRKLISEFTHLGKRNFYSYSKRAHQKLPKSIVKRQLRRHFVILLRKVLAKGK
ncbi:antiviral reverse transcriptase Drt2 [Erythrobacter sp. CCH5-A1]|jgi:hypothetical protein|uniref:antiviral reverse transcriptase Drt2 n=1 Tax=Erythrobacter sp. CCH5-A1 TaxID=1768792 RepID=UPI0009ECAE4B|nr:antiviral reverse transcriptase Drt2 [Erythrobacter sp. CCH5-A1]